MQFRAKPREEDAVKALQEAKQADFNNPTKLAKEIIEGRQVTLICHMIEVENSLGRSLVIDLSASTENKFR